MRGAPTRGLPMTTPRLHATWLEPCGAVRPAKGPSMNSGSGRSWSRRVQQKIAPAIVAQRSHVGHGKPGRNGEEGRWDARERHAQARTCQRAKFRAIRQDGVLMRTAGHVVREGSHLGHYRHGYVIHHRRAQGHGQWGGQKAHEREDREQTGDERPEVLHRKKIS
jgi:hypothetical protein